MLCLGESAPQEQALCPAHFWWETGAVSEVTVEVSKTLKANFDSQVHWLSGISSGLDGSE